MAQTNVQAFSGDVAISSNVTAANSKFSLDTNGTLKQDGNSNSKYIKLMKYFGNNASNWKIATGSYTAATYQWFSIRAKMTRLDRDVEIIQFNYLAHNGTSHVRDPIIIGGGTTSTQANEIKVYNKTGDSTYEIYLQLDDNTSVEVEISHRNSTIDDDYSTVTTGAIDETGLTKIYDSGTTADLRLKEGNVGIGTTSPGSALDVVGDVAISSNLAVDTNTLFVDSVGNKVGIGTTSPTNSLHVYKSAGEATSGLLIEKASGTAGTAAALLFGTSATTETTNVGIAKAGIFFERTLTNGRGNFQFCLDNVDNTTPIALSNSKMTITSDGKVGVGTASPTAPLSVAAVGSTTLSGESPSTNGIYLYNDTNAANEDATITMRVAGSSAGDPKLSWDIDSSAGFTMGMDNSDSDKFKLCGNWYDLSQGQYMEIDTLGNTIFDVGNGGGTILSGLYNYTETQQAIDAGVHAGAGTITASTDIVPPPGTAGDVIAKFINTAGGEAVTNSWYPGVITIAVGTVIYFGVWIYATQNVNMEFFRFHNAGAQSVGFSYTTPNKWVWFEKTITSNRSYNYSGFRFDNNSSGSTIYLTGVTIRVGQSQNTGLPFTPRYSPQGGKGVVFTAHNLVAKEAAIRTLTGNVGIGTTNPQAPFHVKPVNNSVDTENTLLDFRGDFTAHGYLGIFATETLTNAVGPDLRFKGAVYNGTASPTINQVMCLKPSGNVGIGTASPYARLHTNTVGGNGAFMIGSLTATEATAPMVIRDSSGQQIHFYYLTTKVGSITSDSTSTSFTTSSDYRLKENIVELTSALDRVNEISVYQFNFISEPTRKVNGFIAHELQSIIPEAVTGVKDEMMEFGVVTRTSDDIVIQKDVKKPEKLDEGTEWSATSSKPNYQGVDQSKVVPLLTRSVQELSTKNDTLETQLASVLARLDALENKETSNTETSNVTTETSNTETSNVA